MKQACPEIDIMYDPTYMRYLFKLLEGRIVSRGEGRRIWGVVQCV